MQNKDSYGRKFEEPGISTFRNTSGSSHPHRCHPDTHHPRIFTTYLCVCSEQMAPVLLSFKTYAPSTFSTRIDTNWTVATI